MSFAHLHVHTEYSLLDGSNKITEYVSRVKELGMTAAAITDHGVMSGVPELCDACAAVEKETGKKVKPIYGCEVYFTTDETLARDGKPKLYHLLLLAKTNEGYHNLVRLVSESHVDNFYYKPRTTLGMLREYHEGIICQSACVQGIIPQNILDGNFDEAERWARIYQDIFGDDFYIEIQDHGLDFRGGFNDRTLDEQLGQVFSLSVDAFLRSFLIIEHGLCNLKLVCDDLPGSSIVSVGVELLGAGNCALKGSRLDRSVLGD